MLYALKIHKWLNLKEKIRMFTPIPLYFVASALATEANPHTNPPGDKDIAFVRQQAAKAQKEAKKWLDENKGDFMEGMDKNAMKGSGSRGSCPSRLFAKQGDKAGKGNKENKGGGCFSKGIPPESISPDGASSSHSSFPRESETLVSLKSNNVLIFVSFSMPEASLKSLFQEAQKQGAVLVMRGLYQDSFVQTAQKLQQLGVAVDIHPELFEAHHIVSVPTFIKIGNGRSLYNLKGNVTLDFALKKFNQDVRNQLVGNQHVSIQHIKEAP